MQEKEKEEGLLQKIKGDNWAVTDTSFLAPVINLATSPPPPSFSSCCQQTGTDKKVSIDAFG